MNYTPTSFGAKSWRGTTSGGTGTERGWIQFQANCLLSEPALSCLRLSAAPDHRVGQLGAMSKELVYSGIFRLGTAFSQSNRFRGSIFQHGSSRVACSRRALGYSPAERTNITLLLSPPKASLETHPHFGTFTYHQLKSRLWHSTCCCQLERALVIPGAL
jgi:hypothetical protein